MYKVIQNGTEMGHSNSFGDALAYARTLTGVVIIVSPEGEYPVSKEAKEISLKK